MATRHHEVTSYQKPKVDPKVEQKNSTAPNTNKDINAENFAEFDPARLLWRRLGVNDFQQMYPLFEKLIQNEIPEIIHRSKFFLEGDYSPARVSFSLSHPQVVVIGCFLDNTLVGFNWGNPGYAGLGFISWLMVDPKFRKAGVGSLLLQKYEEYIKSIGGHVIELYCFEGLKSFYEKNGYIQIGMRPKGYFGLKQYIYEKLL